MIRMLRHPLQPEQVVRERFGEDDERYALIGEASLAAFGFTAGK